MGDEQEEQLENPFSSNGGSSRNQDDFLAFSSTPLPDKEFKPQRGKRFRQQNWQRFGDNFRGNNTHNSPNFRGGRGGSPHFRGSPRPQHPHFYSSNNQQQQYNNYNLGGRGPFNNSFNNSHRGRSPRNRQSHVSN